MMLYVDQFESYARLGLGTWAVVRAGGGSAPQKIARGMFTTREQAEAALATYRPIASRASHSYLAGPGLVVS